MFIMIIYFGSGLNVIHFIVSHHLKKINGCKDHRVFQMITLGLLVFLVLFYFNLKNTTQKLPTDMIVSVPHRLIAILSMCI
jgi:hypothetical protein